MKSSFCVARDVFEDQLLVLADGNWKDIRRSTNQNAALSFRRASYSNFDMLMQRRGSAVGAGSLTLRSPGSSPLGTPRGRRGSTGSDAMSPGGDNRRRYSMSGLPLDSRRGSLTQDNGSQSPRGSPRRGSTGNVSPRGSPRRGSTGTLGSPR